MAVIEFHNQDINVEKKIILKKVNLSIDAGEFILLSGVSGSGKTTFINKIVDEYQQTAARVFQNPDQQFTMETPLLELVFLLENLRFPSQKIGQKIDEILREFHLLDKKNQFVYTLSGGEQQRLALAEAANLKSDLVILDEPFASVDRKNIAFLLDKVKDLKKAGKTIIVADHNPLIYQGLANRIFLFENQKVKILEKNNFDDFYQGFRYRNNFHLKQAHGNPRIKIQNLSVGFSNRLLLDNLKTEILNQENVLISGENGSGKSTLLKSIAGLQKYEGKIKRYGRLSLAFQNSSDSFLKTTVDEEIQLSKKKAFNHYLDDQRQIERWLKKLSLDKLLESSVYTLSGGEQKKLQILLLVIQAPEIVLLDEPFSGLDKKSVLNLISLLQESRSTKIFISHQLFGLDKIISSAYLIKNKKLIKMENIS
ncbi:cobalt ABC transporter [Oenococcus oeni]|uniref:ATP-binding cassette domain-containing protein n=3 Tax=Oenococcus oeni TaxID=1247 RepID=UPI0008F85AF6|nr:ATP-binding cassette domain-containing protein [Oenococcus oeni]OIL00375.1 cobalt ABC transporter [Oenococcus oeni]PDH78409.1 cobalt ABC transporter [Oenococcus oeni]PDH88347.1 cobalt ABC transporter [Oenococcus oeni]PDH90489.1 cobalt ABC transporter [Oenococcus oeni]PDH93306.1 cobalt ABC transporter [Oenococcus oeni]